MPRLLIRDLESDVVNAPGNVLGKPVNGVPHRDRDDVLVRHDITSIAP